MEGTKKHWGILLGGFRRFQAEDGILHSCHILIPTIMVMENFDLNTNSVVQSWHSSSLQQHSESVSHRRYMTAEQIDRTKANELPTGVALGSDKERLRLI